MSTIHEDAANDLLTEWQRTPEGMELLGIYAGGLRSGRWGQRYLDVVGQQHVRAGVNWPSRQIAAFALVHSMLMNGDVGTTEVGYVREPLPDAARVDNQAALADLPQPFVAHVDPTQNAAGQDGWLEWTEPIMVEWSTGVPLLADCGAITPAKVAASIPAGRVPLEVGTTKPSRTLLHLRQDGGVARWPYGQNRLTVWVTARRQRYGTWKDGSRVLVVDSPMLGL